MEYGVTRSRVWLNVLLFVLTVFSTFFVGLFWSANYIAPTAPADETALNLQLFFDPRVVALALLYAVVLLTILLGHEFGHYLTCRRYGVSATLPFFIPAPTLVGTLGAVIRIKSPITRKHQLFDIGAAGPLTGFTLALPALFIGLAFSKVVPHAGGEGSLVLGEPLLFKLADLVFFRNVPPDAAIALHPAAFAGWVGLLVTAFNLFPLGQLDGGHIAYALFGPKTRVLSKVLLVVFVVMSVFFWIGWLLWAVLIFFIGLKHPQVLDEDVPLSRGRRIVAVIIILIFVLSFIPDPVKGYGILDLFFKSGAGVK